MLPEGPAVFLLLLLVNVIPALAVQRSEWNHLIIPVAAVSCVGFLAGWVMARCGVLDSISHIVSVALGAIVSYAFVLSAADDFEGSIFSRTKPVFWHIRDWYLGQNNPEQNDDIVLSLLLGVIVWMLAYLSAWVLFRRGWLMMALALPMLLLLVNLGYAPEPEARFTVLFVALSVPLAARYHLFRKQASWARFQLPGPSSLGMRFLSIGAVLAILITTAGWNAPDSISQETLRPLLGEFGQQIEEARENAQEWLDRDDSTSGLRQSGSAYSEFEDSFTLGGELELSDRPEVEVVAEAPTYLVAQHYNVYSGTGWSSNIEETFNPEGPNGQTYAPAMSFRAGQEVILSDDITATRDVTSATITPLTPTDGVLLSVDTYLESSVDSSVKMSWMQLDGVRFAIDSGSLAQLPPDLLNIAVLLRSATLDGAAGEFGPLTGDDGRNDELLEERETLVDRFLEVSWEADAEGQVTDLIVTGQIPVYDDVESVRIRGDAPDAGYEVTGSVSAASADDLRSASDEYPDWVVQRYMQLPSTITPRTTELTLDITAGAETAYDKARAVEAYLRDNIAYDTSVGTAPEGQDAVDYLLFDNPRGFCEHYATAMTVMLRTQGIPARVVAGYAPGEFQEDTGSYIYLQSNAHAWVEVFFPGFGWVPFEPTASESVISLGEDGENFEPGQPEEEQVIPTEEPEEITGTEEPVATPDTVQDLPVIAEVDDSSDGNGGAFFAIAGAAVLAVVAGGGVIWWLWTRQLRGLPASTGLFVRLLRLGRMAGVPARPSTTPSEYATTLAQRIPVTREYAQRIVHAYELDQYAEQGSQGKALETAVRAWRHTRAILIPTMLKRLLPGFRRRR